MAQVALNQKHDTIGREKRWWKRRRMINWGGSNKRTSIKQKSWREKKKLKKRWRTNVENSFITFDFWNADIKKKKKTGRRHIRNILILWKEACDCKNGPDHWRHQEETRAWDGASFTPQNTLPVWLVRMWNEEQGGSCLSCLNVFEEHKQRQGRAGPGRAGPTTLYFGPGRAGDSERVMQLVSPAGSRKFLSANTHAGPVPRRGRGYWREDGVVSIRTRGRLETWLHPKRPWSR